MEDSLAKYRRVSSLSSSQKVGVQEQAAAGAVKGYKTRRSGAGRDKGDAKSARYRVECKRTDKQSLSLKVEWLAKITEQARLTGREPMLHVEFDEAPVGCEKRWVMITQNEFEDLTRNK